MTRAPEVAVVTIASAARRDHLDVQLAAWGTAPAEGRLTRIVVWLDADAPRTRNELGGQDGLDGLDELAGPDGLDGLDAEVVLSMPPGPDGLRLAAARNAGADEAVASGARLVVFLDADCVPDRALLSRYVDASERHPGAVLCGPVTYLPPGVDARDPSALDRHRSPHPARPAPPAGVDVVASADEYALFWSLSFALTADRWQHGPRFDERFEGYGGEDTAFAYRLRADRVPLVWVGGAEAFHQHHPTTTPPVQHLDDILRNGALFASTWGEWPMLGWLEEFERQGLVAHTPGGGWQRVVLPH